MKRRFRQHDCLSETALAAIEKFHKLSARIPSCCKVDWPAAPHHSVEIRTSLHRATPQNSIFYENERDFSQNSRECRFESSTSRD
jgi:hypothetical protein